jgi:hypothetical protein
MTWNRKIRPEQTEGLVLYTGSIQDVDLGNNSITASNFIGTASFAVSSSQAISSSFANNSISASYALTASYLENNIPPFPYTGSAIITGSLTVTGSLVVTQNITANTVRYNTAYSITGNEPQGAVYWNADRQTLQLKMNGTDYDYGMGLFFYIKNQSGVQINKGDVVGFAGTLGMSGIILGAKYVNDGSQPSNRLMGVAKENIPNGGEGKVVFFGEIRGINTNAFTAGTILYASNVTAGALSSTIPNAGTNKGEIAAVVSQSSTVGTIFVRALINKNIDELNNVDITTPVNGQLLAYNNGLWQNQSVISGSTGYIPKFNTDSTIDNSIIFQSGSTIEIQGDLETTGSISSSTLVGIDNRVVVSDPSGTLQPTSQTIIDAYIDPNGPQAGQLNTTSNWSIYGEYIGTPISDTFQGQRHYNIDYFFECVNDNEWIRLIRG